MFCCNQDYVVAIKIVLKTDLEVYKKVFLKDTFMFIRNMQNEKYILTKIFKKTVK